MNFTTGSAVAIPRILCFIPLYHAALVYVAVTAGTAAGGLESCTLRSTKPMGVRASKLSRALEDGVPWHCDGLHEGVSKPAAQPASGKAVGMNRCNVEATERRPGLADVLDGMKAAGIDSHPHGETAEAYAAGQACLFLFSVNMMVIAVGHWGQLATDERFVYAPDAPRPHKSETLRFVRVLDFVVVTCWSVVLAILAFSLHAKCITPAHGRRAVMCTMSMAVLIYLMGAAVDYLQCHFQAGGIGSHCHGFFCIQTAAATLVCVIVGHLRPRLLFMVCFGMQGALRLEWASRAEKPGVLHATVIALAVTLIVLPIVAYFQEISSALRVSHCVAENSGKERDLEMDMPDKAHAFECARREHVENVRGYERASPCHGTDSAAAADHAANRMEPMVYIEAGPCQDLLRSKEDDARVGCGAQSSDSQAATHPVAQAAPAPVKRAADSSIASSMSASFQTQDQHGKLKHTDRKRKRREEQNTLVAKLDRILPEDARRGGFKGAGPRSAGVWGRSFLNVLTDTIEHVKNVQAGAACTKPKTLEALRLSYRDGEDIALEAGWWPSGLRPLVSRRHASVDASWHLCWLEPCSPHALCRLLFAVPCVPCMLSWQPRGCLGLSRD